MLYIMTIDLLLWHIISRVVSARVTSSTMAFWSVSSSFVRLVCGYSLDKLPLQHTQLMPVLFVCWRSSSFILFGISWDFGVTDSLSLLSGVSRWVGRIWFLSNLALIFSSILSLFEKICLIIAYLVFKIKNNLINHDLDITYTEIILIHTKKPYDI